MLEILLAVKNNNMKKIPSYDPQPVEQLQRTLKTIVKSGTVITAAQRVALVSLFQVLRPNVS
jgi:nucleolar MIF4G domain-containing protein 1